MYRGYSVVDVTFCACVYIDYGMSLQSEDTTGKDKNMLRHVYGVFARKRVKKLNNQLIKGHM